MSQNWRHTWWRTRWRLCIETPVQTNMLRAGGVGREGWREGGEGRRGSRCWDSSLLFGGGGNGAGFKKGVGGGREGYRSARANEIEQITSS